MGVLVHRMPGVPHLHSGPGDDAMRMARRCFAWRVVVCAGRWWHLLLNHVPAAGGACFMQCPALYGAGWWYVLAPAGTMRVLQQSIIQRKRQHNTSHKF